MRHDPKASGSRSPSPISMACGATLVTLFALAGCGSDDAKAPEARGDETRLFPGLGRFCRPITTDSAEAQAFFDQGLSFLYGFNHDEAERSFRAAAAADPGAAMAYWGIAMAQGPHINRPSVPEDRAERAREAIAKARAELDRESPVERGLVEAASVRHEKGGRRSDLDRLFAAKMGRLQATYPRDPDVAALHAEALMDLHPWDLYTAAGEPKEGTAEIVGLLEDLLLEHPEHPLGLHLYIHAVEASTAPGRADAAADRLRDLQPGLGHMVHMPSHIDVRRGRWNEAVLANEKAVQADAAYRAMAARQDFYGLYMAHDHHMLAFAAMMCGRSQDALDAARTMREAMPAGWLEDPGHAAIADGFLAVEIEVAMRFGLWDQILGTADFAPRFPIARTIRRLGRGVALAAQGKPTEARAEQEAFRQEAAGVPADASFGNNTAASVIAIAAALLEGEILLAEGSTDAGLASLHAAIALEDRLIYDEPPSWVHPVRHALGAFLVDLGRFEEAEGVYREDLARWPENGWSLFGLGRCLEARGAVDEAQELRRRFEATFKRADRPIHSSCFCR